MWLCAGGAAVVEHFQGGCLCAWVGEFVGVGVCECECGCGCEHCLRCGVCVCVCVCVCVQEAWLWSIIFQGV